MDLCLITIGGLKLYTYEIDIIYLLMEDDDSDWTVGDIAGSLPYIVDDLWDGIQSLILSGILERTDMTHQHASDIDDAFILLNPDMFDVVEAAEA